MGERRLPRQSVCYLLESTELWGGVKAVFDQAERLARHGWSTWIATKTGPPEWIETTVPVVTVPHFGKDKLPPASVYVGTFWSTVNPAFLAGDGRCVHLCQGYEAMLPEHAEHRHLIEETYRLPTFKIATSPQLRELVEETFGHETRLVRYAIDSTVFHARGRPEPGGPPRVAVVGPYALQWKGIGTALRALRRLRESGVALEVVRISQSAQPEDERAVLAADEYHRHLDEHEVAEVLRSCAVAVSASTEAEGFGIPAVEAMACGCAAVLSDIRAYRGFGELTDGAEPYALFCPPGDAEAFAGAVRRLLEHPEERRALAAGGARVARQFDGPVVEPILLEAMAAALEACAPPDTVAVAVPAGGDSAAAPEHAPSELERLRDEAERWQRRAAIAEAQLGATALGEASTGWRLFVALAGIRWRLAPEGTRRDRAMRAALRTVVRTMERVGGTGGAAAEAGDAPERPLKAVLFVSQAPEVSRRYRCDHQAEQLELLGATVDTAVHGEVDLVEAVERYGCVVLHRFPWGGDVEAFVERARAAGTPVVFDTDDLTFDPDAAEDVAALARLSPAERKLYVEGLERYRRTMLACDAVTVSTEPLRRRAAELHDRVAVTPNVASAAMLDAAAGAAAAQPVRDGVTYAYLSGTPTHDRDFLEAADALVEVLRTREDARFLAVGPVALDDRFDAFGARVERLPLQPWEALPELFRRIDVNLAPLERENAFTECKSCVKWIEAGVHAVPTFASPLPDFARAVEHGRTGLLVDTPEAWRDALLELGGDERLRGELGRAAASAVRAGHTTRTNAPALYETLHSLAGGGAAPLSMNWIMLAPIAQNSGGYRNIFRIANHLGAQGHRVRMCVDPVAHLEGLSDEQIRAFLEDAFGPLEVEIVVGAWNAPAADVSIATHWPTAATVAAHARSLFKAYFIQDFEPEFYADSDARYAEAAATYALPLRHICLGRHLADRLTEFSGKPADSVDFALDEAFRLVHDPAERGDAVRVLFFARPELRRRGYALGVEALARLKEARPECEIVFFGSDTEQLGEVPFEYANLGVLDAQAVAAAMNAAHVLLALSLTNISNVPYEGMACGCAVLDVDIPNVSSMVDPGRNCVLAAPEAAALGEALVQLVDDRELRERLGRRGAADASIRSWPRTGAQFEAALRRLCFARLGGSEARPEGREPAAAVPA